MKLPQLFQRVRNSAQRPGQAARGGSRRARVLLLALLLSTSVSLLANSFRLQRLPALAATATSINVDAGQVVGPVKDIFGTILREQYFRSDDPLRPWAANRYGGRTVDRMRELAPINGSPIPIRGISQGSNGDPGTYDG